MSISALLAFFPAILNGVLLAHLLWPERSFWAVAVKFFLGIGLGLGLRSLFYFLYLLVLAGHHAYLLVDLGSTLLLILLTVLAERRAGMAAWSKFVLPHTVMMQRIALAVAAAVVILSLFATSSYILRRRQGDWDAWMMYNRAARFLFIDQANWLASFSPRMDPIFHPDYPLLLAGDIVAGWDILGHESASIPMLQSVLFSLACLGLFGAVLASVKSFGQATLGVTILWGIPAFVNEGARQMADVPMAFFILATAALLALYALKDHPGLLGLAGLTAGLGAWTKNEGAVLIVGAGLAIVVLFSTRRFWRTLLTFAVGVALPGTILAGFRLLIAPAGDILSAAAGGSLAQALDLSRHALILQQMWGDIIGFGGWGIPGSEPRHSADYAPLLSALSTPGFTRSNPRPACRYYHSGCANARILRGLPCFTL